MLKKVASILFYTSVIFLSVAPFPGSLSDRIDSDILYPVILFTVMMSTLIIILRVFYKDLEVQAQHKIIRLISLSSITLHTVLLYCFTLGVVLISDNSGEVSLLGFLTEIQFWIGFITILAVSLIIGVIISVSAVNLNHYIQKLLNRSKKHL